jgi:hypothetical protein
MPDSFNVGVKRQHKRLIKTGHDVPVIKPTSEKHNYHRLDHPCLSVLTQLLQRDKRKMNCIKQEVSNIDTKPKEPELD